jgi:hypothetical protein
MTAATRLAAMLENTVTKPMIIVRCSDQTI